MKRFFILTLALLFLLPGLSFSQHMTVEGEQGMDIDAISRPLNILQDKDFDRAYYSMMICHYETEIQMSEQILATTSDPQVKDRAEKTIMRKQKEIEFMQKELDKMGGLDKKHYGIAKKEIMRSLESGEADSDSVYIARMIPCHESTIKMSKMAKTHTKNPRVIRYADDVISSQGEELDDLRALQRE